MNLLVTGGCGFIGANFVRWQREHHPGDRVVVLDKMTYAGDRRNLEGVDVVVEVGDVVQGPLVARVLVDHKIEAIVHFAAESHVDRSILGPSEFVRTNVVGTATLLERARLAKVDRFVQVSTDEVYGDIGVSPPSDEAAPAAPRSPYAASKAAADHLVMAWVHTYKFPAVITRSCNNYGPLQLPEKLIPLAILRALDGRRVPVYGDGRQVREWLHVEDHCVAIDLVLRRGRVGEVYNVGSGEERFNLDVVHQIIDLAQGGEVEHVTDRPGHDLRYALDSRKIAKLGWAPAHRFDHGLSETVAWYRANRDRWVTL